jgi:ribosomal protein S3
MLEVVVYTAKAVLILGKTGENKEKIETLLTRKL